jgi:hypothetical protein
MISGELYPDRETGQAHSAVALKFCFDSPARSQIPMQFSPSKSEDFHLRCRSDGLGIARGDRQSLKVARSASCLVGIWDDRRETGLAGWDDRIRTRK